MHFLHVHRGACGLRSPHFEEIFVVLLRPRVSVSTMVKLHELSEALFLLRGKLSWKLVGEDLGGSERGG